jgi:hypothetical protein
LKLLLLLVVVAGVVTAVAVEVPVVLHIIHQFQYQLHQVHIQS